jgi:hypothetical protein
MLRRTLRGNGLGRRRCVTRLGRCGLVVTTGLRARSGFGGRRLRRRSCRRRQVLLRERQAGGEDRQADQRCQRREWSVVLFYSA